MLLPVTPKYKPEVPIPEAQHVLVKLRPDWYVSVLLELTLVGITHSPAFKPEIKYSPRSGDEVIRTLVSLLGAVESFNV